MKINFAMWDMERHGGTRVVFEVANRLEKRGHSVTFSSLGYPGSHAWFPLKVSSVIYAEEKYCLPLVGKLISHIMDYSFFKLNLPYNMEKIQVLTKSIPSDIDFNIATYFMTAYAVYRSDKGRHLYYIQHYEPLFFEKDPYLAKLAEETYYLPLTPITISDWLTNKMKEYGKESIFVSNAVNHETFYPRLEDKAQETILSIFRGINWKGEHEVIEALKLVSKTKKIKLIAIGVGNIVKSILAQHSPINFEIELHQNPNDDELALLYSKSKLYFTGAWYEGFPLPPLESMACGTPVVTTDILGVNEYAINEYNSLMVPVKNVKMMAEAILRLLQDEALYEQTRKNGIVTANKFTWDNVVDRFENGLQRIYKTK